jgi:AAA15 family ATPase/GTPase
MEENKSIKGLTIMLKSLIIENFRCFPHFELSNLGRVNLLVGKNNSGKTSILEAIRILYSQNNLKEFIEPTIYRGEYDHTNKSFIAADLRHLFYERDPNDGSFFLIESKSCDDTSFKLITTVEPEKDKYNNEILSISILWNSLNQPIKIPLLGLDINEFSKYHSIMNVFPRPTRIVSSLSLNGGEMRELHERIATTSLEDKVVKALRIIEPKIERYSPINFLGNNNSFIVRFSGRDQQIPIGSMGDGIWRILGLALSIVNAKDGILLVDEIDTGLHYTAMNDMWKMIWQTANDLNVQVFATTHSNDCWKSLAELASTLDDNSDGIAIHRIEKGHDRSIFYTEREMAIAAERDIEVR